VKTVKVLHLTSTVFGGIESYIFSHYKHMNQKKFHFDFITQNQELESAEQYRDFQYKVYPIQAAVHDQNSFKTHIRKILQNGYDILHLHTSYWTGFLLEELAKEVGIKKVIVHCHSSFIDEPDDRKREELLRHHEQVKQAFSPELATDFWACSKLAADWLFGPQIPREKIRIMRNAIELDRFQFNQIARKRVRAELGADSNTLILGTTGRLTYSKNHEFLIEVFKKFHIQHNNSKLIIIGDGELRGDLEVQIGESELERSVLLLGWKNNVEDYLSAMDCFLLPSRFEGFPISALEASVSGLNCVISDFVSNEIVFSNRVKQIPLKYIEWISALENVTDDPFDRSEGVNIVRNAGYDVREQAKVLESLYKM